MANANRKKRSITLEMALLTVAGSLWLLRSNTEYLPNALEPVVRSYAGPGMVALCVGGILVLAGRLFGWFGSGTVAVAQLGTRAVRRRLGQFLRGLIDEASPESIPLKPSPLATDRQSPVVRITGPAPGAHLPRQYSVSGIVTPAAAAVYVVVHPISTGKFWPQEQATVRSDGSWRSRIYIGSDDPSEVGMRFEIMAVANPTHVLEGTPFLDDWPASQAKSETVKVYRAG